MTVMGDASRDRLSYAGSIPARSMKKVPYLQALFLFVVQRHMRSQICHRFLLYFLYKTKQKEG